MHNFCVAMEKPVTGEEIRRAMEEEEAHELPYDDEMPLRPAKNRKRG